MRFVLDSPLELGFRVWPLRPPTPSLTVIAKGTFDIAAGSPARFADEPVLTTGEVHVDDDVEQPLARPDDFALLKPVGEAFVVGSAWAPRGVPTTTIGCVFRVGPIEKRFAVMGDRVWQGGLVARASAPVPFTSMPLHMGRAYGGEGYDDNPWGRGREPITLEDGSEAVPLPNLEQPGHPVDSPSATPDPVVLAGYPTLWPDRIRYAGSYDGSYLEDRWPWLPADFDWRFFLSAPEDQRLREGFWRGDEPIEVEGLHPEHVRLRSTLPKIEPRVCIDRVGADGARVFEAVPLRLDTVVWDAAIGKLVLVWRGLAEIRDESLADVHHLFVTHDPLDGPRRSLDALRARRDALLAAEVAEEEDAEGAPPAVEEVATPEVAPEEVAEETEADEVDPTAEAERALTDQLAGLSARMEALGVPTPDEGAAPPEPKDLLTALREAGVEITPELEELAAPLPDLPAPEEEPPPLPESPAALEGRALVEARLAAGEPLSDLDLTGADLSGLDLCGQDLSSSVLAEANLSEAKLRGANLAGAVLRAALIAGADLSGADLSGADLSRANLNASDLLEANLEDADLEEAVAVNIRLHRARAARALFVRANLEGSMLSDTDFLEADFEGANLRRVDATRVNLTDATLEGAVAEGAAFDRSRMRQTRCEGLRARGARFGSVDAEDSYWEGADLREADFSFARLDRADFSDAILVGAELDGCHLVAARFERANAHSLRARRANLKEASFQGADLTLADLRGANLYAADFWRATVEEAQLELAVLTLTLLAP